MASELVASKSAYCDENTCTRQSNVFWSQYADFTQQVQTPLSLKQKTFSGFFIAFWNLYELENISKKGESSSLSISEIIDSKIGGYLSAWKALLQKCFR